MILTDLSGNGNDMTVTRIKQAGDLLADKGLNLNMCYCVSQKTVKPLSDFTLIFNVAEIVGSQSYPTLFMKSNALKLWWWGGWTYTSFGKSNASDGKPWRVNIPDIGYLMPASVWGNDVVRGSSIDTISAFQIGGTGYGKGRFYSALLFDRTLTDEERNYIIDNCL